MEIKSFKKISDVNVSEDGLKFLKQLGYPVDTENVIVALRKEIKRNCVENFVENLKVSDVEVLPCVNLAEAIDFLREAEYVIISAYKYKGKGNWIGVVRDMSNYCNQIVNIENEIGDISFPSYNEAVENAFYKYVNYYKDNFLSNL